MKVYLLLISLLSLFLLVLGCGHSNSSHLKSSDPMKLNADPNNHTSSEALACSPINDQTLLSSDQNVLTVKMNTVGQIFDFTKQKHDDIQQPDILNQFITTIENNPCILDLFAKNYHASFRMTVSGEERFGKKWTQKYVVNLEFKPSAETIRLIQEIIEARYQARVAIFSRANEFTSLYREDLTDFPSFEEYKQRLIDKGPKTVNFWAAHQLLLEWTYKGFINKLAEIRNMLQEYQAVQQDTQFTGTTVKYLLDSMKQIESERKTNIPIETRAKLKHYIEQWDCCEPESNMPLPSMFG